VAAAHNPAVAAPLIRRSPVTFGVVVSSPIADDHYVGRSHRGASRHRSMRSANGRDDRPRPHSPPSPERSSPVRRARRRVRTMMAIAAVVVVKSRNGNGTRVVG